jgi:hypothetical protein
MVLNEGEICIRGNKYRIVGVDNEIDIESEVYNEGTVDSSGSSTTPPETFDTAEAKLDRIIELMGGGSNGGGYKSIKITLPPREQKYEVMLGVMANQIHIRADQGLTVNMNSKSGDDIFIELAEFPFSLSELRENETIHTLFFTTGANTTNIKILAIGAVQ